MLVIWQAAMLRITAMVFLTPLGGLSFGTLLSIYLSLYLSFSRLMVLRKARG